MVPLNKRQHQQLFKDLNVIYTKSATPTNVTVGGIIQYTLVVTNSSTVPIVGVLVREPGVADQGVSISNVRLNGVLVDPQPTPETGVAVGTLPVGGIATITFDATVLETAPDTITNQGFLDYSYYVGSTLVNVTDVPSDIVNVNVIKPGLEVEKYASSAVVVNDGTQKIIEYTLYVRNTGNVDLTNVVINDALPTRTTYRPNSTYIGTTGPINQSPEPSLGGITVGTIPVNSTIIVRFSVNVNF